jgi:fatty acid hydroxylase domain-containing protein 2
MRSHLVTYWVWLTFAVFSTITTHSGYHLPFLPSSERHDYHHLKFNVNFGPTGLLDALNKTNRLFLNTPQEKRNCSGASMMRSSWKKRTKAIEALPGLLVSY